MLSIDKRFNELRNEVDAKSKAINKNPKKGKGKCFAEGCEVTRGHYEKLERCTKFCNFFICKEHWEAGCVKLKEYKYICPGCALKLDAREVIKYKKSREYTPIKILEEKDMEYKLPKDD